MPKTNQNFPAQSSENAIERNAQSAQETQTLTKPLYNDFSIDFSPSLLMQFIQQYGLKVSEISGNFLVDYPSLDAAQSFEEHSLDAFIDALKNWQKTLNWGQLFTQVNTLLNAWINDYLRGASLDAAFLLARSVTIQKEDESESIKITLKFQLLLSHLLARASNQFDHYKFDYWQHFNTETSLPNQQLLLSMLGQILPEIEARLPDDSDSEAILTNAQIKQLGVVVIHLNIDFDEVFKHNTASATLVNAAVEVLKQQLNQDAILFHIGTHEFAVLVKNLTFTTQLNLIISKLMHAFEDTLPIENTTLILTPYFGGASTFNPETNEILLFEHAKLALHHAMVKNTQMQIYEQNLANNFIDNHLLEEAIIEALQKNELATFLQPIVSITEEKCATAEVLLRWPSTEWPYVNPARLIDTIYKKGFGKVFIRWLINNACQRCADLLFQHHRDILLTVNVSMNDLLDPDLPILISQAITLWEIPAKNLVFEITESDLLNDETKVSQVIDEIKQLGCQIALDDFGTGYSSMARLRNMPVDFVKIDQSFVRNIVNSPEDFEIVQTVTTLAHNLGKQVVCEGVEDIETVNLLKTLNCEKIQGYFYSKPLSFENFVQWLNAFDRYRPNGDTAT